MRWPRLEPAAARGHQEKYDGREQHEHHADVNDGIDGLVQPWMVGPTQPMTERKIAQWHRLWTLLEPLSDDTSDVRTIHSLGHFFVSKCALQLQYSNRK